MSATVPIALYGWPFVVIGLFALMKPRHAVIAAFIFAWLFLPMAGFQFTGIPDYTKMSATVYGALAGVILFDAGRLLNFRPSWLDIPMLIWCVVPMASSLTNGLGAYDGASQVFTQIVRWGLPYFIGRLYFSDLAGLRELAIGIFLGGLIYVPFVLYEMRMSPQLHNMVYGFHQHSFGQTIRFGGWRPTVFMQHGLAVSLWMCITGLIGLWLWRTRALLRIWNIPLSVLVPVVLITAILCRSAGAVALLAIGIVVLIGTRFMKIKWGLVILIIAPIMYMSVRAPGMWDGSHLVDTIHTMPALEDRAGSLQYRLQAEDILADHALERPWFGWGTWGRNRPGQHDEDVQDVATDGLWIIALGTRGILGLAALTAVILLPAIVLLRKLPVQAWWHPQTAPAAILALVLILFMIDSLFNAMLNPIFLLAAGGLGGWLGCLVSSSMPNSSRSQSMTTRSSCKPRRAQSGSASPFSTSTLGT